MGIKDFAKITKNNKTIGDLYMDVGESFFKGKNIIVDAFIVIKSGLMVMKEPLTYEGKITSHIKIVHTIINKFKKLGVARQLWVFDGKSHPLKKKTIEKRKKAGSQPITYEQIKEIKELLVLCGIPHITIDYVEAEFYGAYFVKIGKFDFVYTTDTDVIIRGGDILSFKRGEYKYLKYSDVIEFLNISHEQLVKIAVHMGCDFCDKTNRAGPKSILSKLDTPFSEDQQEAYNHLLQEYKFDDYENEEIMKLIVEVGVGKYDVNNLREFLGKYGFSNLEKLY